MNRVALISGAFAVLALLLSSSDGIVPGQRIEGAGELGKIAFKRVTEGSVPQPANPTPTNKGKAAFVVEELSTRAFRVKRAAKLIGPDSNLLPSQLPFAKLISQEKAEAAYADTFPFWDFKLAPGSYRMVFQSQDAAWTNKLSVGTITAQSQEHLDRTFGVIDNRGNRRDVTFTLNEATIVRFEAWTDQPSIG